MAGLPSRHSSLMEPGAGTRDDQVGRGIPIRHIVQEGQTLDVLRAAGLLPCGVALLVVDLAGLPNDVDTVEG